MARHHDERNLVVFLREGSVEYEEFRRALVAGRVPGEAARRLRGVPVPEQAEKNRPGARAVAGGGETPTKTGPSRVR